MKTFYGIHIAAFQIGTSWLNFYLFLILMNFRQKESKNPSNVMLICLVVFCCSFLSNQNQRQIKFYHLTPWQCISDVQPRYLYSFYSKIVNELFQIVSYKKLTHFGCEHKSNLVSFCPLILRACRYECRN